MKKALQVMCFAVLGILIAVLVVANLLWAGPKDPGWVPPGHRYGHGGGDPSTTANAAAIAAAQASSHSSSTAYGGTSYLNLGQGAITTPVTVNQAPVNVTTPAVTTGPTNVSVQTPKVDVAAPQLTQGSPQSNITVLPSETPKVLPIGSSYIPSMYPVQTASPGVVESQSPMAKGTVGARQEPPKVFNLGSHWSRTEWAMEQIVEPKEIKGLVVVEDELWKPYAAEQLPPAEKVKLSSFKADTPKATELFYIYEYPEYKGGLKAMKQPHEVKRRTYIATEPYTMLYQLQRKAMWDAKIEGCNGLRVEQITYRLKNNQKGGQITAGMMANAIGSILGQNAIWNPFVSGGYGAYDGTTDALPILDVTTLQVR